MLTAILVATMGGLHGWLIESNLLLGRQASELHDVNAELRKEVVERKKAEEGLRKSEERFRALVEATSDWIWEVDQDGTYTYASPRSRDLLGYEPDEIIGKTLFDLMPPDEAERVGAIYRDIVSSQRQFERLENVNRDKKGGLRVLESSGVPIFDATGRFVGYRGIDRDITERIRAEGALRESEQRYRNLFEEAPIGLWELDFSYAKRYVDQLRGEGVSDFRGHFRDHPEELARCIENIRIADINKATLTLYMAGSKKEFLDALGGIIAEGFYGEFVEELIALTEGKTVFEREVTTRTFTGEEAYIHYKCSVVPGYEETFSRVLVSIVDITTHKRMEEEVLKIEKLESLGVLAGGIAHDFNNVLTPILANISIAKHYGDLDDDIAEMLTDAEKASLHAKSLTQQLLTFSKGGGLVKKSASVSKLLEDASKFALSGSNVRYECSIPEPLWPVEMDEGQITQVIHNMIINADQAMPGGGTVKIRAENVATGPEDSFPLKKGKYVRISIADQGVGIPEKQLPKIFDPFYTTKEKGSGLGLSTSFTIVDRHDGTIQVESHKGVGTTFHIYLPASEKDRSIEQQEWKRTKTGQGRVLLVDDQEAVRKVAGRILERLGYEVEFARDGAEGIKLYEGAMKRKQPFDMVILDLTIPGGMGGRETIQELKKMDPGASVIVSSGYSDDPIMSDYKEYGVSGVVTKPYRIDDLAEAINMAMGGP
jgi:PAS domain S-box-containing protein